MSKTRESGFYWVKHFSDGWIIARWNGDMWYHNDHSIGSICFSEIDERRIVREETKDDKSESKLLLRFLQAQFEVEHDKWFVLEPRNSMSDTLAPQESPSIECISARAGLKKLREIIIKLKKEIDPTWSEKRP